MKNASLDGSNSVARTKGPDDDEYSNHEASMRLERWSWSEVVWSEVEAEVEDGR